VLRAVSVHDQGVAFERRGERIGEDAAQPAALEELPGRTASETGDLIRLATSALSRIDEMKLSHIGENPASYE